LGCADSVKREESALPLESPRFTPVIGTDYDERKQTPFGLPRAVGTCGVYGEMPSCLPISRENEAIRISGFVVDQGAPVSER